MVQVNWTPLSRNELKAIFESIGKEVTERGDFAVRELVEGNYRIIYKLVDKGRIDILTIHHRSRDFNPF